MAVSPHTTDVMKRLPQALRPNPFGIDEEVMKLVTNGWTVDQIMTSVMADRVTSPGHVVTTIRGLTHQPHPGDYTTSTHNETGPCPTRCDNGWTNSIDGHSTVPCPTCRPDTHRRVTERAKAQARGASPTEIERIMIEGKSPNPVPHTYWTSHA